MAKLAPHASITWEEIEGEGSPSRPLDFTAPQVMRGMRVSALVVHPRTGQRDILHGVIHKASYNSRSAPTTAGTKKSPPGRSKANNNHNHSRNSTSTNNNNNNINNTPPSKSISSPSRESQNQDEEYTAYFPQRRLQDAIFGSVWACLVLKRHYGQAADDAARAAGLQPGDPSAPFVWEIVGTHVAIKMMEWAKILRARGRLLEDPLKEVAAMQLVGTEHPHVLGSREVLQDDDYLFSVMPYARGGDLFGSVVRDTEARGGESGMAEPNARFWFRQILEGLYFLQSKGICHRDLSLENILVDEDNSLIIDFGMCLRVPYSSREDPNIVTDVTHGGSRRLIKPMGTCGKHNYMSPEIYSNRDAFDGFAVDLWAAGVILYIMLTGFPPYDHATLADERFEIIAEGQLVDQLQAWDIRLSQDAGNLLQSMLQYRPSDRLTLSQIMNHPWVTNPEITPPPPMDAFHG